MKQAGTVTHSQSRAGRKQWLEAAASWWRARVTWLAAWRAQPCLAQQASNVHTAAASPGVATPLTALLSRHVLQDGEIILLVLKPSMWFIILSMLRFAAAVGIVVLAAVVYDERLPGQVRTYVEAGIFVLGGRLMWSVLSWMGRWYMLTDMRIVSICGVFGLNIFDCPLRKVARTRILYTTRERLLRVGSIEIIPSDQTLPIGLWQTVARPIQVHEQIISAITRARQGGRMCDNGG
ncbi:MAG TPA: hypothetical protein VNL70_02670 [Tepidisphaeraceae bacterium]|nr:hypothetical protein [Tepidisphaeraceae bacterium]